MLFRTEIDIISLNQTIVYGDGLLFLGSCFADEVGNLCRGFGFNAQVNPFGVLYNPFSIANAIQRLHSGKPLVHEDVIRAGEKFYCTFSHNTEFWNSSEEALLDNVNQTLAEAHNHFVKARWIVVSLGTAWVYRYRETQEVVANCHKLPAKQFDRYCLSVEDASACLKSLLQAFPEKQFIFTVSPLRHLKDGLHGNQLSKSTLLLAVNQVCERFDNAHYFPLTRSFLTSFATIVFTKRIWCIPRIKRFVTFGRNSLILPLILLKNLHFKPLPNSSRCYTTSHFSPIVTPIESSSSNGIKRLQNWSIDSPIL